MDRYLVISSDCHAGLPGEQYREYLDPQYREAFDQAYPIQKAALATSSIIEGPDGMTLHSIRRWGFPPPTP